MGKGKYLSKNILVFTLSTLIPKLLSFFFVPYYTNILSTAEYGIIDIVTTTISLCLPVFSLNMAEGVMRFSLDDKGNAKHLIFGIKVTLIGGVVLFCLVSVLKTRDIFKQFDTIWFWIPLLFFVNSIYNLFQYYLRAVDKTVLMVIVSCINSLIILSANIVSLGILHLGIAGFLLSSFSGFTISDIILFIGIISQIKNKKTINNEKYVPSEILKYCIPTIFTTIAWWVNSSLDRFFVIGLCGDSANGIYSIAYKIPNILGILQNIFIQAWTLSAIVEFDKNDENGFFGKIYETYNGLMVLSCSFIILLNEPLSKILYSKGFFEAWHYVPILLISSLFSALNGFIGSIFIAVKKTKICAYSTICSAIVNAGLNTILIPQYKLYGAAFATLVSYFVAWLIRFIVSRKYIHMKIKISYEIIGYILIIAQMYAALQNTHGYYVQIVIVCVEMIVLYRCAGLEAIQQIKVVLRKKISNI